ncbi:unnamed protein product [Scytosiphon promiscuus]
MMALPRARMLISMAITVGLIAGASSALELRAASCPDLLALPTTISEDTTLILEEPTETYGDPNMNWISCDEITTVHVDGPYKFVVTSDLEGSGYNFENARFEIKGGADLTFELDSLLSFNYAASQGSDGGAIYVESGSSATFDVRTSFEGNTVDGGYSGGVLYAGGDVEFKHSVDFISNEAGTSDGDAPGDGGAVAVGPDGSVNFLDFSDFTDNKAHSGGKGGALANAGSVFFGRRSSFTFNMAGEDENGDGGYGGAMYADPYSSTKFKRRTIWHDNEAASGGALYNLGYVELYSNVFFRRNKATGSVRAEGGHIYLEGLDVGGDGITYAEGSIDLFGEKNNFREGEAQDGGAFFIGPGSVIGQNGAFNYIDNTASRYCNNEAASRISGIPRCWD